MLVPANNIIGQGGPTRNLVMRVVVTFAASVAANTTVTMATVTRLALERFMSAMMVTTNTAGIVWQDGNDNNGGNNDRIFFFFTKTANADEFQWQVRNELDGAARTCSASLIGVRGTYP